MWPYRHCLGLSLWVYLRCWHISKSLPYSPNSYPSTNYDHNGIYRIHRNAVSTTPTIRVNCPWLEAKSNKEINCSAISKTKTAKNLNPFENNSINCTWMPESLQSKVASLSRSLMASSTFFNTADDVRRASNMMLSCVCVLRVILWKIKRKKHTNLLKTVQFQTFVIFQNLKNLKKKNTKGNRNELIALVRK